MSYLGLLVIVALLVCVPLLLSKNPQLVDLNYHFGSLSSPLSHQLLIAFCVGFAACVLIFLPIYLSTKWRLRKARKRIIALEGEAGVPSTVDSVTLTRRQQKKAARKMAKKQSLQATRSAREAVSDTASSNAGKADGVAKPAGVAPAPGNSTTANAPSANAPSASSGAPSQPVTSPGNPPART